MEFGTAVARRLKPSGANAVCTTKLAVLHGSSTTWFQTSRYCRTNVEFNSINLVQHGSSTTFETPWTSQLGAATVRACTQITFARFCKDFEANFVSRSHWWCNITIHLLQNSRIYVCRLFYCNGLKCIFICFTSKSGSQRTFGRNTCEGTTTTTNRWGYSVPDL